MLPVHVQSSNRPLRPPDAINQMLPSCLNLSTPHRRAAHIIVSRGFELGMHADPDGGHQILVCQMGICLAGLATKPCQLCCCLRQCHLLQLPAAPCQLECCWQPHQRQGQLAGQSSRCDLPHHGCAAWLAALPCRTGRSMVIHGLLGYHGSSHADCGCSRCCHVVAHCMVPHVDGPVCQQSPMMPPGTTAAAAQMHSRLDHPLLRSCLHRC